MTSDERPKTSTAAMTARDRLLAELREHALVIGEVVLTSGATAQYLVDAKRAILRRAGFMALGELVAAQAAEWSATAVGGMTMGADPIACAALAAGADVKAFFVRKESSSTASPAGSRVRRSRLRTGACSSRTSSRPAARRSAHSRPSRTRATPVCGVVAICDRLAGGAEAISAAAGGAPYVALTTIDDVYQERPDR